MAHAAAKLPQVLFELFFLILYAQKQFGTKQIKAGRPPRQPPYGPMNSCIINGNAYKGKKFCRKTSKKRLLDVITRNDDDTADSDFHRAHVTRRNHQKSAGDEENYGENQVDFDGPLCIRLLNPKVQKSRNWHQNEKRFHEAHIIDQSVNVRYE